MTATTQRSAPRAAWLVWLLAGGTLCAAIALAMVYVVLPAQRQDVAAAAWVDHTHQVIAAIDDVLASAADAETGQRGFLLTGDDSYLEPYDDGARIIWLRFADLQRLTTDNPSQQNRLMLLRGQLQDRLAALARTIELARGGNAKAALEQVRSGQGKAAMDAVRATAADMAEQEERLLLERRAEYEQTLRQSSAVAVMLAIFGGVGILVGGGAIAAAVVAATAKRRSAAAAAARLRLLNMLDLAPIMMGDLDGTVRFWSEGCRRLYGWTAEHAIGRPAHELLRTEFPVSPDAIRADLKRTREWRGELRSRTQDGAEVIALAHKFLEADIDGGGLGVMETVTDVTALRHVEAELRASEARLRLFIDNAPASIAMFDTAMCYLAVSGRFLRDLRLDDQTPAGMVGRCHYDILPEIPERWREVHRRVLAGESLSSEAEPFPRADGYVNWVRWEMTPWRNADGTIGGALLFSEDMTERNAAQAALQYSEARLRLVQKVGGIAYYDRILADSAGVVSDDFTNMFGLPAEQTRITPAEFQVLVHPDDRDRVAATASLALAQGGRLATEFRVHRTDGALRWINMRAEIFPGPDDQPHRVIIAFQDITEIVAARDVLAARHVELERSNAELEQFAHTISHDLKAPLRAIGNLAQWIGEDMKDIATPDTIDNLGLLHGRVARMQMLLSALMEYSRAGQLDKAVADVAVADVVANIVAMQAPPAGFAVGYEGEQLTLRTHPVALQVVLENLIGNALKHHDRGEGRITVRTRRVDGLVEFRVSDDGPGIPEQFHRRIFDIFQTLQSHDDLETSGLGLAIVKRKVESHGGRIRVESAPPARGTSFVFTWQEAAA